MLLPVSAPFHCALMQPAADAMAEALAKVDDAARRSCRWSPTCPAQPIDDPDEIAQRLVEQVTGHRCAGANACGRWPAAGVTQFYEVGAGKVLTGLVKRIAPGATGFRDRNAG